MLYGHSLVLPHFVLPDSFDWCCTPYFRLFHDYNVGQHCGGGKLGSVQLKAISLVRSFSVRTFFELHMQIYALCICLQVTFHT